MDLISIAIGAAAGALVTAFFFTADRSPASGGAVHALGKNASPLHGRILPGPLGGSPSYGLSPRSGYATEDGYEWAYEIGAGDSVGSITEAVTGSDDRYQELLLANPEIPTVGEPGVYLGDSAWEPAPGSFKEGVTLLLPIPWSRYVDQTGNPRGSRLPFPEDPRQPVLVSGDDQEALALAAPAWQEYVPSAAPSNGNDIGAPRRRVA